MAVELGNRLDRDAGTVERAAECPPESVIGELESGTVADLVDNCAVEAVTSLGIASSGGAVVVVAPDQEFIGNLPRGVELVHPGDDLVASGNPAPKDLLGVWVERDASPLAVPLAFPADGDIALAGVFVEVDVSEAQPAYLHNPEAEAELQVDDDLLERSLLHVHELLGLLVREPVDVGADVLAEVHAHLLHNVVLEVGEVSSQDVQVPVLGGHREVALLPESQEELDCFLIELAGVGGVSVLLKIAVDLVEDSAVLRGGLFLRPPVAVGNVLVDARYSRVVALCHGCHSLQSKVVEGLGFHSADPGLECEEPGSLAVVEHL